jgi:hypothetical protein
MTKCNKHAFRFKIKPSNKVMTVWAKVVPAKKDVFLTLKVEHVRRAIKLRGAGNTQCCAMAVCAQTERQNFPHSVPAESYIDWYYYRAYITSRIDKNGLPSECYVYAHWDGIGRLNDTMGGLQQLLKELEAAGGERIIHLLPPQRRPSIKGQGRAVQNGRRDGSRTKVQLRGSKLRAAIASMGGVLT